MTKEGRNLREAPGRSETGLLVRLAFPVVLTNCTLMLMQITDAWMLGKLGSQELAAITPSGMLIFMFVTFGYSFLSSVTTFVSQSLGRSEAERCGYFAWQGLAFAAVFGIAVFAFYPTAPLLFGLFQNQELRVLELEVIYFEIGLMSVGPSLMTIALANFFIGIQRTSVVMISAFTGLGTNIVVSYSLIFGTLGMPELGFAGAAWGTVVATVLEVLVLGSIFLLGKDARRFGCRRMRFGWSDQVAMARIGVPAGFQGAIDALSFGLILSWLVAFYGTAHQAAATILIRLTYISFLPAEGLAQAMLTRVGSAAGRRDHDKMEMQARLGFRLAVIYMSVLGVLFLIFRYPLVGIFTDDPEVAAIAAGAMVFVCLAQFFDAMHINYVHALQGVGDNLWPSILTAVVSVVVLLGGGIALVTLAPETGSRGIWAVFLAYTAALGLGVRHRWRSGVWKRIDLFGAEAERP
jgi:MATE family multidrug resistance protein